MKQEHVAETPESNVRYYSRIFPSVFAKAKGSYLFDVDGNKYLDFFSGAGALNYGHNNPLFKDKLISYIQSDGITHSLDMMTEAKNEMMNNFQNIILKKRNLNYKIQFTGPTGTDAVEAALKLSRKYTGRKDIVYFSNSYHGMSMGSLSVTPKKNRIGIPVGYSIELPFYKEKSNTNQALEAYLESINPSDYPAAIVLETVQAEGGINVASVEWLQNIQKVAADHKLLLIVDDVQVGVGRTGNFFSFERAGIVPDMVCLSKSISGYGTPLSLLLIKPSIDVWEAGEHTGTFRGFNLSFITATEALLQYWQNDDFLNNVRAVANEFRSQLLEITINESFSLRGIGFIYGIDVHDAEYASKIRRNAFKNGLIFETCGPSKSVIKMIPPLTSDIEELKKGVKIFAASLS